MKSVKVELEAIDLLKKPEDLPPQIINKCLDVLLGEKGDFIYATQEFSVIAKYANILSDYKQANSIVLRWLKNEEEYFEDIDQSNGIKTPSQIPIVRLEYCICLNSDISSKENNDLPTYFETLEWKQFL